MKTKALCLLLVLTFAHAGYSQKITKLKEFSAKGVTGLTVDRLGNFFLIFKNGIIKKYDPNGNVIGTLKKSKLGQPTLLEPWFHPSIFSFYRDKQQWITYDREFKNPQINQLDPAVAINPYLVCPTNDNRLLVFDKADFSVKKINRFTSEVVLEFAVDTVRFDKPLDIQFIKEYQSMIFLLDKNNGVLVYNSIGRFLKKIGGGGIQNFGFYGEELFYQEVNRVILFDFYTEKTRSIPLEKAFSQSCITDERLFTIDNYNKVIVSKFEDSQSK